MAFVTAVQVQEHQRAEAGREAAEAVMVQPAVAATTAAMVLPRRLRLVRHGEQLLAAVFLLVHLRYALNAKHQSLNWWLLQAAALAPTTIGLLVFLRLSTSSWLAVRQAHAWQEAPRGCSCLSRQQFCDGSGWLTAARCGSQ